VWSSSLKHRDVKVKGETRIPAGRYQVTLRTEGGFHSKYSEKYGEMHKGMLWVRDVPGFEYILIHTGNTDEHTAGCLLVGNTSDLKGFVGSSNTQLTSASTQPLLKHWRAVRK
jgi:hypothetical protein